MRLRAVREQALALGFIADVEARDVLQPHERDAVGVAGARERGDLGDAGAVEDASRAHEPGRSGSPTRPWRLITKPA
jgi:hypothetical protein